MDTTQNKKILLIVEDQADYISLLKEAFDSQSVLSIISAQNGEEGLTMAQQENPDAMIIDIDLGPESMNGIEMARKIKESGVKTQMVFLTNSNNPEDIAKVVEIAGATGYIIKSEMRTDKVVEMVKTKLGIV